MPWIAGLVTAGAGLLGAEEQEDAIDSANAANNMRWGQALKLMGWFGDETYEVLDYDGNEVSLPTIFGQMKKGYGQAEQQLLKGKKYLAGGFERAERAINKATAGAGQSAYKRIAQGQREDLALQRSRLERAGLGATTVGHGLARRSMQAANRSYSELAERIGMVRGNLLGQLEQNRAAALAGHQSALATFYANRAQSFASHGMNLVNTITQRNDVVGPTFLDTIGGAQGLAGIYAGVGGIMGDLKNWWSGGGSGGGTAEEKKEE